MTYRIDRRRAMRWAISGGAAALLPATAPAQVSNNVVIGKDGWLFPGWEDVRHVDLQKCRRVSQLIGNAVAAMQEGGIAVAIALTPTKARIYPEFLPDTFKSAAETNRRYSLVREDLRRSGATVPDMAAVFAAQKAAQPNDLLFFKADTHWTPMAAELAATDMARQVKQDITLPPARRPGTQLGSPVTMRYDTNDLALLLSPGQQRNYPAQTYRLSRPTRPAGPAGLVEEDDADVMVIGNSYMQVGFGFPPMLSSQLGRPVGLVWKVGRVGPFRTLLDYLAGDLFRARRPKLLVWHFLEGNMEHMPDVATSWGPGAIPPQEFLDEVRARMGVR